ncbi:hypothetical protein DFH06DRAFT_1342431 [Mycena polygramma]|nr:hypothetical protein DFH06DRAFT_1342431 [Mycena polygramma]
MAAQSTLRQSTASNQPSASRSSARHIQADKENEHSLARNNSNSNDSDARLPANPKRSQPRRIESDDDDDDVDYVRTTRGQEDAACNSSDDDMDTARGRTRRVSDKQAQLDKDKEEAKARKHEKALKAARAEKRKTGVIEADTRGPIDDDHFSSRTVEVTRPTATKNLAQRNSKVPHAPAFPSQDWHASSSSAHRRDRDSHVDDDELRTQPHRTPATHQPSHTFRGRSPSPDRIPIREPIRNINGGVVPDSVTLHLAHEDEPRARQHTPRRRRRSPSPQRSPPRARSVSPAAGDKRRRSSSIGSEDLLSTQAQRTSSGGRPRAKDLDDTMREYAVLAMDFFRCYLSTEQAFPDTATENEMVRRAWHEACAEMGEGATLTPPVAKLISSRGSQLRGELKTKIKPLVDVMYGFRSGQNKKTIAFNRKLAEDLKEKSRFAFKDVEMQTGLYKHPILQSTVNAMWFANRRDEGPRCEIAEFL